MANRFGPRLPGEELRMRDDFIDGLRCFKRGDYESAVQLFRAADVCAGLDDIYQSRYTSFHGLSRVYMGDNNGVKLCRKAVAGETQDAEVFYNLVLAEHRLGFRESAYMALCRGLNVDSGHAGLLRMKQQLVLREKHGFIPGLKRNNVVNRLIGKLVRGTRLPYHDKE
jgi:hypothetical protein